ncbi:MAG: type II toxin-antitoxin system HicB family antitoxin [Ktedonobacteraceae bacterium]|nr:type II toxin-antitoxin system HicB family antitoxin [Ktedonobacteraceae bacterium]
MAKYRYLVLIEKGENNYGAYAPDLPGCGTIGDTPEEALKNAQEAISLHLEGMLRDNDPIPPAAHIAADFVEVDIEV